MYVNQRMEGLANEKMALEQTLAKEKQALNDEKQDLSDQLKQSLNQLKETQSLLEQEQALRIQLEGIRDTLETEKATLQQSLQDQIDETSSLKNELLKLQANYEKDRIMIESIRRTMQEQEEVITRLREEEEESAGRRQQLEAERDDLHSQIIVLTEERDMARSNEEDLFEALRERTHDLERLQESYVDMTDRCNDYQDEVSELREQVDDYQRAIIERESVLSRVVSPAGRLNGQMTRASIDGSSSFQAATNGVVAEKKLVSQSESDKVVTTQEKGDGVVGITNNAVSSAATKGSVSGTVSVQGGSGKSSAPSVSVSVPKSEAKDEVHPVAEKKIPLNPTVLGAKKPVKLPVNVNSTVSVSGKVPEVKQPPLPVASSGPEGGGRVADAKVPSSGLKQSHVRGASTASLDNYDDDFDDEYMDDYEDS